MRRAIIFDVEGTLVDSVRETLACWRGTLAEHGHPVAIETLQRYSGMDGNDMLKELVPDLEEEARKMLLAEQGKRFAADYLPRVVPFPEAQATLQALKSRDCKIALATDCKGAALEHYRAILQIDALLDALACGEDVREGKPNPELIVRAYRQLGTEAGLCAMVGDTPYDARAGVAAGIAAFGVLTGGFKTPDLQAAGCVAVFPSIGDILRADL
jgi:phosphoglycolate phosphatase-like HAD superfamily hydrolase